jgi:hypothetical protein
LGVVFSSVGQYQAVIALRALAGFHGAFQRGPLLAARSFQRVHRARLDRLSIMRSSKNAERDRPGTYVGAGFLWQRYVFRYCSSATFSIQSDDLAESFLDRDARHHQSRR